MKVDTKCRLKSECLSSLADGHHVLYCLHLLLLLRLKMFARKYGRNYVEKIRIMIILLNQIVTFLSSRMAH